MGSSATDLTGKILRHERALIAVSVAALAAFGWWYLATRPAMTGMAAMRRPSFGPLVVMWSLMMVAMMLPSAAPAVLLYSRVRHIRGRDGAIAQSWVFLAGYLLVWLLFSILAAAAQQVVAGPRMALGNRWAEGALLVAAGVYELTPLKNTCLARCRSPAEFISRHWRPGAAGAVRLGALHGLDCLGCCWMLMLLLFVGGVMNLLWIVGLTLIVAIEKLLPRGEWFARVAGVALIAWGVIRLAG